MSQADPNLSTLWLDRALQVMPGLNSNYASARSGVQTAPLVFERAEGLRLIDPDGRDYIDFVCGMGPAIWGNGNREYLDAIHDQLDRLMSCGSAAAFTTAEIQLAEKIVEYVPCAEQVRFAISGSEADQLAIRLARGVSGKRLVLRFEGHYHGWLDPVFCGGAAPESATLPYPLVAASDSLGLHPDVYQETLMIPWNDAERLERTLAAHGDQIALVLMEAIMCNNACCPPRPGYLETVRELCTQHGVLLAFDEVITGFRVALGGAQELFDVTPDLAIFAKAMAGGLPLSCVAGNAGVMAGLKDNSVLAIGTFNSFPLAMAAAVTNLDMLARDGGRAFQRVDAVQAKLIEGIRESAGRHGHRVLLQGPRGFVYLDFTDRDVIYTPDDLAGSDLDKRQRFRALLHQEGVIIGGNSRLVISGELSDRDIDDALCRIDRAFATL